MPSLEHEAPLVVLREEPELVAVLLREALQLTIPAFTAAEVADGEFTEARPAERRADLVVYLKEGSPPVPVLGVIIEVQRQRDEEKRRSWPLYAASLHARLGCQTCLVVIAPDEGVARWAATAIETVPMGSPFVPLVIGPRQVPRFTGDTAPASPWMALLSALIHGNHPGGDDAIRAAATGLRALPEGPWRKCYDLLYASLDPPARAILEEEMHFEKYEYRSEHLRRAFGEGRQEGELAALREVAWSLLARHGGVREEVGARLAACDDAPRLRALVVDLAGAVDLAAAESLIESLPSAR